MNALAWFLCGGFVLAVAVATSPPRQRVRHHRWRNRRFLRTVREIELRSRAAAERGGSGEEAGSASPAELPALAGGEARAPSPVYAALPPAPLTLVGAADPRPAALTRPPRVRLGGEL